MHIAQSIIYSTTARVVKSAHALTTAGLIGGANTVDPAVTHSRPRQALEVGVTEVALVRVANTFVACAASNKAYTASIALAQCTITDD